MDQQLLPPYSPTTVNLNSPMGKLPLRYPPLSPKSAPPTHHARREDRCGNLHRTIALCVLALAVCAGFVLLYCQMRDLERQVAELMELTIRRGSYDPFNDEETEPDADVHPGHCEKILDGFTEEEEDGHHNENETADHEVHTRERRSAGRRSYSGSSRFHVSQGFQHDGEPTAHVVPLNDQSGDQSIRLDGNYNPSEWFRWTDQSAMISHASIPLHPSGKCLIAPHAGYYYIYSQITLNTCDNDTDTRIRGHSLNVRTNCGRAQEQRLTYTTTTPFFRNPGCNTDSSYLGGVYYLEKNDFVGVKPYMLYGTVSSRYLLMPKNSYFGMFPIRRFDRGTQMPCHINPQLLL